MTVNQNQHYKEIKRLKGQTTKLQNAFKGTLHFKKKKKGKFFKPLSRVILHNT